jgi:hypothetical protein
MFWKILIICLWGIPSVLIYLRWLISYGGRDRSCFFKKQQFPLQHDKEIAIMKEEL